MRARTAGLILLALLVLGLAVGVVGLRWASVTYASPPRIRVVNHSRVDLRNVVLEGSGFRLEVEHLPAHASTEALVHVNGESSLQVAFTAGSTSHSADDLAYLEERGGYVAVITIDEALGVHVDQHLMGSW